MLEDGSKCRFALLIPIACYEFENHSGAIAGRLLFVGPYPMKKGNIWFDFTIVEKLEWLWTSHHQRSWILTLSFPSNWSFINLIHFFHFFISCLITISLSWVLNDDYVLVGLWGMNVSFIYIHYQLLNGSSLWGLWSTFSQRVVTITLQDKDTHSLVT